MNEIERINSRRTAIIDLESPGQDDIRQPYLFIRTGNENGCRYKLKRGIMTIGRSLQADITIDDDRISRTHCIIEWFGNTLTIEDKGSTNGTYVGTKQVNRALLLPGVSVQLGHSIMKVEYKTDSEIRAEESLLYKASFDPLTGIYNRQHFIRLASMEMSYAGRHNLPMGVIMMNIDDFRLVNETFGHKIGDNALIRFVNIIIENKHTEDLIARFSGEKFVNLPRGEINKEILFAQCERIRRAVENVEFRSGDACFHLTVSLGFHLTTVSGGDVQTVLDGLIQGAEQALHLAKDKGKNRTECLLQR